MKINTTKQNRDVHTATIDHDVVLSIVERLDSIEANQGRVVDAVPAVPGQ